MFASRLRRAPPLGTTVRPTVIFVGRGDQSAPLVDSAFIIKEGALEDRTVRYRHDLVFAANPTSVKNSHTVYRFQGPTAPTNSITVAIQQQFSRFFASDGASLEQTSPYLETPMKVRCPLSWISSHDLESGGILLIVHPRGGACVDNCWVETKPALLAAP